MKLHFKKDFKKFSFLVNVDYFDTILFVFVMLKREYIGQILFILLLFLKYLILCNLFNVFFFTVGIFR